MDDAASSTSRPPPAAAAAEAEALRVVIFPWLAFGHLLPYLELAERLASRGHRVWFVSTPGNVARLPALRAAAVEIVELPLPRVDGLPDGAESTNDVPDEERELHWRAFDGLAGPFAEFLAAACADEGTRPDWIIADSFHHFVADAAVDQKVPYAMLLPTAAMLVTLTALHPSEDDELDASFFENPAARSVPRYEQAALASLLASHGSSEMTTPQRYASTKDRMTLAAIRSCPEWEPECFHLVEKIFGKPVVPLGLVPPSPDGGRRTAAGQNVEHSTVRWLDGQPPSSVLYVALGSEVPLPAEQVHELAMGLELAGTRFLWALRKPSGVPNSDFLPAGFQERTHGRGLVTMGWVPQMTILAHAAVGGFLTHCGRNSLIEGLLFGHPLIMLPIFGDQGSNARLMELKNVGLHIPRDENDGSLDRHGVASAVRTVMLEEEARRGFVANALKMQAIVTDKELHERYIDEFIHHLRSRATDGHFTPTST